jgi:hypothetical protein
MRKNLEPMWGQIAFRGPWQAGLPGYRKITCRTAPAGGHGGWRLTNAFEGRTRETRSQEGRPGTKR